MSLVTTAADVDRDSHCIQLKGHTDDILSVVFSPDGKHIISSSKDNTVRFWDTMSNETTHCIQHSEWIFAVATNTDATHLAYGDESGVLTLCLRSKMDRPMLVRKGYKNSICAVTFLPTFKYVVSGGTNGMLYFYNIVNKHDRFSLSGHPRTIRSIAASHDGQHIASGSSDNTVRIWGTYHLDVQCVLVHPGWVNSVAFSPDSKYIISGCNDKQIRVWDIKSQQVILQLHGHTQAVTTVVFSPDGKYIASGSDDTTVRVWDATTGVQLQQFVHDDVVLSISFSPDGTHIVSGGENSIIRVWAL